MIIRRAHIADVSALSELFDAYRVWYRKESNLDEAKSFLTERITHNESVVYVAEVNNKLVGFTQLYPLFSSTRMKRMWLLNDLYVAEAYRSRGISKALINAAKNLCTKTAAAGVLLETEQSNTIGNKLYPSMGFHLEENNFYFWTNNE